MNKKQGHIRHLPSLPTTVRKKKLKVKLKKKRKMEEVDTASDLRARWSFLNYDACELQTLRERERERGSNRRLSLTRIVFCFRSRFVIREVKLLRIHTVLFRTEYVSFFFSITILALCFFFFFFFLKKSDSYLTLRCGLCRLMKKNILAKLQNIHSR